MFLVLIPQPVLEFILYVLLVHCDHFLIHLMAHLLEDFLHLRFIQPAHHILTDLILRHDPLKHFIESHIKLIILCLGLDQYHPRHIVEFRQTAVAKHLLQRFLQRQPLA